MSSPETLAEIAATLMTKGSLRQDMELRRLGSIMTKLNLERVRSGHHRSRGYIVREHTPLEIDRMHEPDNHQ